MVKVQNSINLKHLYLYWILRLGYLLQNIYLQQKHRVD